MTNHEGRRVRAIADYDKAEVVEIDAPTPGLAGAGRVSSETAAPFGLVYQTAYFALTDRGQCRQGDSVLVLGASHVSAATRGAANAEFLRDIGADSVVDVSGEYMRDALRDGVMAATNGHGAEVVIDPVGGEASAASIRAMAWCGRLVFVGFASGVIPKIGADYRLEKNISASGIEWADYRARQPGRARGKLRLATGKTT